MGIESVYIREGARSNGKWVSFRVYSLGTFIAKRDVIVLCIKGNTSVAGKPVHLAMFIWDKCNYASKFSQI